MAQTSITLTASMRSNLSSLKSIQGQMDKTQERLSSGKKVNSAIDNASSYYQARSLTNRAADLDSLLDSMGQGIQTIQAANEGIEAITSYVEQAKSIANSAYALDPAASNYADQIKNYQDQYNQVINEIETLAKDASYQGINLLKGSKLEVMFNETRTHSLTVQGDDVVNEMAKVGFKAASWIDETAYNAKYETLLAAEEDLAEAQTEFTGAETALGATVAGIDKATFDVAPTTYYTKGNDGIYTQVEADAVFNPKEVYYTLDADKKGDYETKLGALNDAKTAVQTAQSNLNSLASASRKAADESLDAVANATDYLRSYATELGNNFTIIETRQDFTEALVDVLETGSDNLVLADMNEESANYLALQTRQQLAVNSLSLASQSAQSVLSLF